MVDRRRPSLVTNPPQTTRPDNLEPHCDDAFTVIALRSLGTPPGTPVASLEPSDCKPRRTLQPRPSPGEYHVFHDPPNHHINIGINPPFPFLRAASAYCWAAKHPCRPSNASPQSEQHQLVDHTSVSQDGEEYPPRSRNVQRAGVDHHKLGQCRAFRGGRRRRRRRATGTSDAHVSYLAALPPHAHPPRQRTPRVSLDQSAAEPVGRGHQRVGIFRPVLSATLPHEQYQPCLHLRHRYHHSRPHKLTESTAALCRIRTSCPEGRGEKTLHLVRLRGQAKTR